MHNTLSKDAEVKAPEIQVALDQCHMYFHLNGLEPLSIIEGCHLRRIAAEFLEEVQKLGGLYQPNRRGWQGAMPGVEISERWLHDLYGLSFATVNQIGGRAAGEYINRIRRSAHFP
jgi:hypothetical protein